MKKIATLLLLLVMLSSMVACGDKSENSVSESSVESSSVSDIKTEQEAEEVTIEAAAEQPTEEPTESPTEAPTEAPTVEGNTEETTEEVTEAGISSSFDYVTAISEQLDIADISEMQASSIGAIDGTSFTYNGNKFEVYRFDENHSTLSSAADDTVIQAFNSIQ